MSNKLSLIYCNVVGCSYRTLNNRNFKDHVRNVHGLKHNCPYLNCNYKGTKKNLNNHIKTKHTISCGCGERLCRGTSYYKYHYCKLKSDKGIFLIN